MKFSVDLFKSLLAKVKAPFERKNSARGIQNAVNRARAEMNNHPYDPINDHVFISDGNDKLKAIKNVNLPPIITCSNCNSCKWYCYAVRVFNRLMSRDRARYCVNLQIFLADSKKYFDEISFAVKYSHPALFRWHSTGDIVNAKYYAGVVHVAKENPGTRFLIFTKNFKAVNQFYDLNGIDSHPVNLKVIFSAAPGVNMENKYHFCECHINFENPELNTLDLNNVNGMLTVCPGDCTECALHGEGCFNSSFYDTIVINQH